MKTQLQKFACPIARYRGVNHPGSQEFNAHLQSFAHRVSLLAALHTGGNLPTYETYQQLLTLWEALQPYCSLIADGDRPAYPLACNAPLDDSPNGTFPYTLDAD
jgi:hypothetical protein